MRAFKSSLSIAAAAGLFIQSASAASLLGYFPFEGNFNDASGNGNNAAAVQNPGEVSFTGGFRGQGADINDPDMSGGGNTGGSIEIPINVDPGALPGVTFGGWVNVQSNNAFPGFMATDNGGWDRGMSLNTNVWSIASGGNTNSTVAPTIGSWEYVVGTFGGGDATLYMGGAAAGTQTTVSITRPDAQGSAGLTFLEIGRYDNQDLDAVVDDIFVFGDALNSSEVNAIRNLRLSGLDYSPELANALFELFDGSSSGSVGGLTWSPVTGLDPTNPGEVFDMGGGQWGVVLDGSGNGLMGIPEPTAPALVGLATMLLLFMRRRRR